MQTKTKSGTVTLTCTIPMTYINNNYVGLAIVESSSISAATIFTHDAWTGSVCLFRSAHTNTYIVTIGIY